jgi:hypothetical protein
MAMSKPKNRGQEQKASKPDVNHPEAFEGSSFAPNTPDGPTSDIPGFVTAPDANGASRRTLCEARLNNKKLFPKGPPADACRKFIAESAVEKFPLAKSQIDSIQVNCGAANMFLGMKAPNEPPSLESALAHTLESRGRKIIPDARALRGTGEDGTPPADIDEAMIAFWDSLSTPGKPYYVRTPFAEATDPPRPLGT